MTTAAARRVRVWDLPTRLFHWALVGTVAAAMLIGYLAPAWWLDWHLAAGYGVGALLGFRLIWGLFGGQESRFGRFPLAELRRHLAGLARGRPPRYLGHNPAGALMILALLGALTALVLTGLVGLGGVEKQGPLAGWIGYAVGRAALDLHAGLGLGLGLLVAGHLAGVLIEGLVSRENLVVPMISGYKEVPPGVPDPAPARGWPALVGLAGLGLVLGSGWAALASVPAAGVRTLDPLPLYQEECGACHWAHHPSLLPGAAWTALLDGLEDHFGEVASLDAARAAPIRAFLSANAAETWDTEAAHNLTPVATEPGRISAGPYWRRRHQGLTETDFSRPSVGGRANCQACHRDADQGLFADQAIQIDQPTEELPP